MRIAVCDDEKIQMNLLSAYICEYGKEKDILIEVKKYDTADALWWDIQDGFSPDLLMLDIQMEHMTGIELAHRIRDLHLDNLICFITGVKDYVFEGYDVNAIGYILKPFEKAQIFRMLEKADAVISEPPAYTVMKTEDEMIRIYHKDIVALEAVAHNTVFWMKQSVTKQKDSISVRDGISECIAQLGISDMIRIHRSYAVNMQNIAAVRKDACVGTDGKYYPVSRANREDAMQAFIRANRGNAQ